MTTFAAKPFLSSYTAPALASPDAQKLIDTIRDQTDGVPAHLVFVLDVVSCRFGGYFTPEIKAQIEKFPFLQMLTLNDCGIKSLQNFPHLPGLIRLDLVFNQIDGATLHYIRGSRHLQTLMLGANLIEQFQHVQTLKGMKQLLQLDLINNPISRLPGYRERMFNIFPSMTILDTLDKGGKDAYTASSMATAASRVPDVLFDKSAPAPYVPPPTFSFTSSPSVPATTVTKTKSISKPAISFVGTSSKANTKNSTSRLSASTGRGKGGKLGKSAKAAKIGVKGRRTAQTKTGLVFPIGRLKRKLSESMPGLRISKNGAVYLASVLEYLTTDLLEGVGSFAKQDKKQRIMPSHIKNYLKNDQEMFKYLSGVTFSMTNQ